MAVQAKGYITARLVTGQLTLVRDVTLPPFEKMPRIILYGHRAFRRITASEGSEGHLYAETTCYQVPFEDVEQDDDLPEIENA